MIIEFSIQNFRSFKERCTFSMESIPKFKELTSNIKAIENLKILKTAVFYGKNASGKSNLILAFKALSYLIDSSGSFKGKDPIKCYEPYKFDENISKEPVKFEIVFIGKDNIKYRYSISYNFEQIINEELHYYPKKQPVKLFTRDSNGKVSAKDSLKKCLASIEKKLFKNQLLLSKISTEKIDELLPAHEYLDDFLFVNILQQSCSLCDKMLIDIHTQMLFDNEDPIFQENINKLLRIADTGINSIYIKENNEEDFKFPDTFDEEKRKSIIEENRLQIFANHYIFKDGEKTGEIKLELNRESSGTNRLLAIGGLIIGTLTTGGTIIVDELERSLHPFLTKILVQLFNNPKTNPNSAQLIFTTHDVSLLTSELFRRDQIWFAEKNNKGESSIYSLGDINGVRKDVPYHKYYMKGLFGGIPNVNFYDFKFDY